MDLCFIRRSIVSAAALGGLASLVLALSGLGAWGGGVGLGCLWASMNWVALGWIARVAAAVDGPLTRRTWARLAILAAVKFPLLYAVGYLFLRLGFPILSYLVGFWILFAVAVAGAAGFPLPGLGRSVLARRAEGSRTP